MAVHKPTLLALSLTLLGGCSRMPVTYTYDHQAPFAAYKTFDWNATAYKARIEALEVSSLGGQVHGAVEKVLASQGFNPAKAGASDFSITYYPVYGVKVEDTQDDAGSPGAGIGKIGTSEVRKSLDISLVLEIKDTKTQKRVWQGVGKGALTGLDGARKPQELVDEAVKEILARFPSSSVS